MPASAMTVSKAGVREKRRNKPNRIASKGELVRLRLYVADQTPRSITAFKNLQRICDKYLPGRYEIQIVDLFKCPQLAHDDEILSIPTLVRTRPPSNKKIVGDLSNTERVLECLDLRVSD